MLTLETKLADSRIGPHTYRLEKVHFHFQRDCENYVAKKCIAFASRNFLQWYYRQLCFHLYFSVTATRTLRDMISEHSRTVSVHRFASASLDDSLLLLFQMMISDIVSRLAMFSHQPGGFTHPSVWKSSSRCAGWSSMLILLLLNNKAAQRRTFVLWYDDHQFVLMH